MKRPEVVIVGAGIIGAACAAALARAGLRVLVLEHGRAGGGTTAAGGGMLSLTTKGPGAPLRLARRSLALLEALAAEGDNELGLRRCGSLTLARDPAELDPLAARARSLAGAGTPAEMLDGDRARAAEPGLGPAVTDALWCPGDAQVDPARLCQALLRRAGTAGAVVEEGRTVETVELRAGRVVGVRAGGGRVAAGAVVVAAGVWSPALLEPFDRRWREWIRPRAGTLLRSAPRPVVVHHLLLEAGYYPQKRSAAAGLAFSLQQCWDGRLWLGGSRAFQGFDPPPGPVAAIRQHGARFLPLLADVGFPVATTGLRAWTPDGLPLVGSVGPEGLWLAAGHEGDGVAMAMVTGELLAAMLTGQPPPPDAAALDPGRFLEEPALPGSDASE